jgi:formiminoglutamase
MRLPWSPVAGIEPPGPFTPPTCRIAASSASDPRLAALAGTDLSERAKPRVALIGFPVDEGVRRNCGRVGASEAPDCIRRFLYRLTPGGDPAFHQLLGKLHDFGNLRVRDNLEEAQERLGQAIAVCLADGTTPIVLGGGHETSYGHFRGYVEAERSVSILNWDAHPDVRPLIDGQGHSGSPFRQMLEDESRRCAGYTVAGLLRHAVATSHVEFLTAHGARSVWREEITSAHIAPLYEGVGDLLVSFDLDVVDQAFAPGVSAPATGGLPPDLLLRAAHEAGRSPRVRSIDLVEVNPRYDRDDQTSRLAALLVWTFLQGLAARQR